MTTIVITHAETGEVVACVPECGVAILRNDVELHVFQDVEPVFCNTPHGPVLKENTFIIKL